MYILMWYVITGFSLNNVIVNQGVFMLLSSLTCACCLLMVEPGILPQLFSFEESVLIMMRPSPFQIIKLLIPDKD